ncbi:hypothetical protein BH24ACT22_BH24ACT22_19640 [soil metagenome]
MAIGPGVVVGAASGSVALGFVVIILAAGAGYYLGMHGGEAGHLDGKEDSEEGRYAGGHGGFHDGGGSGLG